jgi:hypothetical protein
VSLIHLAWFCKNGSNFACSGIYMCVCVCYVLHVTWSVAMWLSHNILYPIASQLKRGWRRRIDILSTWHTFQHWIPHPKVSFIIK